MRFGTGRLQGEIISVLVYGVRGSPEVRLWAVAVVLLITGRRPRDEKVMEYEYDRNRLSTLHIAACSSSGMVNPQSCEEFPQYSRSVS